MSMDFNTLGVMIVDDNAHMRWLVCSMLRALGIKELMECSDGEEALREIVNFRPDLVITDWHMEPVNGLQLVSRVRGMRHLDIYYVPIIMLTGHSEAHRVREARDTGINEFLAKPISAKSLLTRIVRIANNDRPFIETDTYFGPDRRRVELGPPDGTPERRVAAAAPAPASEGVAGHAE